MLAIQSLSFLGMILVTAPFIVLMILAMLGIDERVAGSRGRAGHRTRFCGVSSDGRVFISDPDWKKR